MPCLGRSQRGQCTRAAIRNGYCRSHQYQNDPDQMCHGKTRDGEKCYARARKRDGYCRDSHVPGYLVYVHPQDLRGVLSPTLRRSVVQKYEGPDGILDAYSGGLTTNLYHLDHVTECQISATILNNAWTINMDSYASREPLDDVVGLLRDNILNTEANLVCTSDFINILKGQAVTNFLNEPSKTPFLDCLKNARNMKFPGKRLTRTVTGEISSLLGAKMKECQWKVDNEADNNFTTEVVAEFQTLYTTMELRTPRALYFE